MGYSWNNYREIERVISIRLTSLVYTRNILQLGFKRAGVTGGAKI
jgi:hypothetical protein